MRCRWSLCVALAFGGDTVEGAPAEPSEIVSASNSCGVHCLIIVATLLRKPVPDFNTLRAMTATTNTGETNMLAMKHAAVAIGLRPWRRQLKALPLGPVLRICAYPERDGPWGILWCCSS